MWKQHFGTAWIIVTLLAGFGPPHVSSAETTPIATIRVMVQEVAAVLEDVANNRDDGQRESLDRLKGIILPRVDREGVAQRCLGVHWSPLSQVQRTHFTELFTELLELSYHGLLNQYPPGSSFAFDAENITGEYAQVYTRMLNPEQTRSFSMNYRLRRVGDQWLIYDLVLENVSLVRNYRNQLNRIIAQSGYEGMTRALEQKIDKLRSTPDL